MKFLEYSLLHIDIQKMKFIKYRLMADIGKEESKRKRNEEASLKKIRLSCTEEGGFRREQRGLKMSGVDHLWGPWEAPSGFI